MLSRLVGLFAACALSASAFLLPPGIADEKTPNLAISVVNPKNQVLELPCSSCVFPSKKEDVAEVGEEDLFFIQGGANNLVLNFTISEDGQALELNGEAIYPNQFHHEALMNPSQEWYVDQVPASTTREEMDSGTARVTSLHITSSGLKISEEKMLPPNGDALVLLRWQLFALEGQPMTVDEVSIELLKMGTGELLIMEVTAVQGHGEIDDMLGHLPFGIPLPPSPGFDKHRPPKECNMLPAPLCKFKSMFENKIGNIKHGKFGKLAGCAGRKGGHPHKMPGHIKGPLFSPDFPPGLHHGPDSHHGRPHSYHGHHHRHHLVHALVKGFSAVLIPVMAGIAFGMTFSLLGLVIGKLIAFLWIKLVRGGRRGYASVDQEEAAGEEGETDKEVFTAEEQEAPPLYEDAPAYEEAEKQDK